MASVFRYYENPPIHQVGDTKMSAMPFDHAGWLICDGRLLDKEYYNNLYGIIGNAFGENEEGTHFRIPNGSGRVAAAIGSAGVGMNNWVMGDVSGEEKHTLTIAEMPAHKHGSTDVTGNTNGNGFTSISGEHVHKLSIPIGNQNDITTIAGSSAADDYRENTDTTPAGNHQHYIGSTGGSQAHNTIQPTIYVGNMFIYGGF